VGDVISTMWTLAPAGARGPVGLAVPTAACGIEPPLAARLRALPLTPAVPTRPGTRVPGLDFPGIDVFVTPATGASDTTGYAQQVSTSTTTEHNGTTLGIHSSGRPSS
jgi:hypothetical protein